MASLLLAIIYLSFISLGLPDSLLGSGWPAMHPELNVPVSYAGIISMLIALCTIISSLNSDRLTKKFGAGLVTAVSVGMTALAMLGYRIFSGANKNKGMKSSVASIVTSVIATLLMLLLAEFFVYSFVMSKNYGLTIFESMSVMPELLRDAEFRKYFITDVLGVWLFAAIGMGGYIWSLVKKGKTA